MATQDVKIRITALDKTSGALRKIGSGLRALTKPLLNMRTALVGVIGGAGIGLLVKQSLSATDALAKTASKIGTTTEALSALQFAGQLTGVEVNTMNMALQRFSRRASEAARGTGEAKGAIRELGIDARELVRLPLDERMLVLADAFQNVKSESDKLRLAFKLFDSEGAALVNTLSQGRSGLAEMLGEAKALGIVMSSEAAAGVESANDEFLKLSSIFKGILDQTTAALAPALEYIVKSLTETLKSFGNAQEGFTEVGKTIARSLINAFAAAARGIYGILNRIIEEYNKINATVINLNIKYDERVLGKLEEEKRFLQELIRIRSAMAKQADLDLTAEERKVIRLARRREINEIQAADKILEIEADLAKKRLEIQESVASKKGITPVTMKSFFGISQSEFESFFEGLIATVDDFSLTLGKPPKAPEANIVNTYIEQLKALDDTLPESEDLVSRFASNTMNAFTTGFTNAITGAENFADAIKSMAKSVVDDLIRMAVQYYITQEIFGAIVNAFKPSAPTTTATSNPINDPFGDRQLARGGVATAGRPYLVGEKGAELFTPNRTGRVLSYRDLMSLLDGGMKDGAQGDQKNNLVKFDMPELKDNVVQLQIPDLEPLSVEKIELPNLKPISVGKVEVPDFKPLTLEKLDVPDLKQVVEIPQYADGGVATGGKPYLVGEKGAELFVPSSTGRVVPNDQLGGGGVTVVQNINVTTGVQQTVRAEIATLLPQISNAAKAAVADSRMRGGGFSKAMGVA